MRQSLLKEALAKAYHDGLRDGTRLTLDHLEARPGDSAYQPQGAYRGHIPPELREWLTRTRESLAEEERGE